MTGAPDALDDPAILDVTDLHVEVLPLAHFTHSRYTGRLQIPVDREPLRIENRRLKGHDYCRFHGLLFP